MLSTSIIIAMMLPMLVLVQIGVAEAQQLQTTPDTGYIVSCTGVGNEDGGIECDWCRFVQMIGNLVQYSIYLAVMLSAIMFAYAGFLFLTNNGNKSNITKAWNIFRRAILGTVAILAAWLIVHAIMTKLATGLGMEGGDWYSISGCESARSQSDNNIDWETRDVIRAVVPLGDIPSDDLRKLNNNNTNSGSGSINVF